MAKILLVSFSGTGNTFLCASFLRRAFQENGDQVTDFQYFRGKAIPSAIGDYDLLGIGYPIHAFNPPKVFFDFLKRLPKATHQKYFIFKVSGEPFFWNDCSSASLVRILRKKGYSLTAEKHFLLPYNIVFRYPPAVEKEMYLYLEPSVRAFVKGLCEGRPEKIRYSFLGRGVSLLFRIEWLAGPINSRFIREKKGKCLHCEKCLSDCPTGSLYRNAQGQLRAHASCALCMRCTMNCPTDALHFGFLNSWKVPGGFHYRQWLDDPAIPCHALQQSHHGFFRGFRRYYEKQDALLKQMSIPLPSPDDSKK